MICYVMLSVDTAPIIGLDCYVLGCLVVCDVLLCCANVLRIKLCCVTVLHVMLCCVVLLYCMSCVVLCYCTACHVVLYQIRSLRTRWRLGGLMNKCLTLLLFLS